MPMDHTEKILAGLAGAIITYVFGGFDIYFRIFLIVMVMDYITGVLGAWYNHELNSQRGLRGIAKKVVMLALVAVAYQMDLLFGIESLRGGAIWALTVVEIISIFENADKMGIQVPNVIKERLLNKGVDKA